MQLNKLYLGDALNILNDKSKIEDNSIQLIFADPPYNLSGNGLKLTNNKTGGDYFMVNEEWDKMSDEEYINFTNEWIKASKRVLKQNGSIFICCSYHNIGECTMGLKNNGFKINNIITTIFTIKNSINIIINTHDNIKFFIMWFLTINFVQNF